MRESLRYLLVWTCAFMFSSISAQKLINLGYCPDEIPADVHEEVIHPTAKLQVQGAIRIPASRLMAMKGAKITKVRLGAVAGMEKTYVYVRPSLDKPSMTGSTSIGTTKQGWNEVTLKKPYVVTGEEIYISFLTVLPGGKGILFAGDAHPNGAFIHDGHAWVDASSLGLGSLCLQAVMEIEGDIPSEDFALDRFDFTTKFSKLNSKAEANFEVSNFGTETKPLPAIYYRLANGKVQKIDITDQLPAGITRKYVAEIPVEDCVEGYNDMAVWLDTGDKFCDNDTVRTRLACYGKSYPRKMLIEHFTTLPCTNCPKGLNLLAKLTEGRKDFVWVAHHVGHKSDELTVQSSYYLSSPLGVNGAPSASFDRTVLPISDDQKEPAFQIGCVTPEIGELNVGPSFGLAINTPAFLSVDIENKYDASTRQLSVTVSGERNELLKAFYPVNCLSVQLVENAVNTKGEQVGSGSKVHNHVFRHTLTAIGGDTISWDGNHYTATFTYTVPQEWNDDNLRVVAFANRPLKNMSTDIQVLNANELILKGSSTAGIGSVSGENAKVLAREYYNLQGQRIEAPVKGVYLEKVVTNKGTYTQKRIK